MNSIKGRSSLLTIALALGTGALTAPVRAAQAEAPAQTEAPAQETFASPDAAIKALRAAVGVHDKAALRDIFGPGYKDLLTGNEAQDKAHSRRFAKALEERAVPIGEKDGSVTLEIGANKWPFPVPLVRKGSEWQFDTAAGREEMISRHIGKDELLAIGVCRAYVQAQNRRVGAPNTVLPKTSFGYRFKLVAQQGAQNGGYSLTAYPERWGRSGIMTFIVNQDGKLYQRDLGEKTAESEAASRVFNSNDGWTAVTDPGITEK
jgi:hypothetical protein